MNAKNAKNANNAKNAKNANNARNGKNAKSQFGVIIVAAVPLFVATFRAALPA